MYIDGSNFEGYNYYLLDGYQNQDLITISNGHLLVLLNGIIKTSPILLATYLDMGDGKLDGVKTIDPNRKI